MAISQTLYELAPTDLTIYRDDRYEGDGFNVTLKDFAPEDTALLIRLYNSIKKIYDLWLYMKDDPNYDLIKEQLIKEFGSEQFRISVQAIGSSTYDLHDEPSPLLRKVTHDIRGGALSVLVGLATMLQLVPARIDNIKQAITLSRDHAKMMRNAIEDIDPVVRMADESTKVHPISDFTEKWRDLNFEVANKSVAVRVTSTFTGNITSRCLETSAIDRILYNYMNNAARFTTEKEIALYIFAINDDLVRWVVKNKISERHEKWLRENVGGDLGKLFLGGITRGGHGIGLSSCSDFVAASFGLEGAEEAVEERYLGAKLIDRHYYAWFHWPAYYPNPTDPVCECAD